MKNTYYERYKVLCNKLNDLMKETANGAKKLKGAIAVELLKELIDDFFQKNNIKYKTSNPNSYIAGSKYEYDLLIVKEYAEPFMGMVYKAEDVIAIIESKVGGLFNLAKDTDSIAIAVNSALKLSKDICFGYITMSENVPTNDSYCGKSTIKHWEKTEEYLKEKINGKCVLYAVTLRKGKYLCDEGSDEEFFGFVNYLIYSGE